MHLKIAAYKPFIIVLLLLISGNGVLAQTTQQQLDSMLAVLPKAKPDTHKVRLLQKISDAYFQTEPVKGAEYGKEALALSKELDFSIVRSCHLTARCYMMMGKRLEGLKYYQEALTEAKRMNDPVAIAKSMIGLGIAYEKNNDFDKALATYNDALVQYKAAGIENLEPVYTNIGVVYSRQKQHAEAIPYYLKAIEMEETHDAAPPKLITVYYNAGGSYLGVQKYDSALHYLMKARRISEETGDVFRKTSCDGNISTLYRYMAEIPNRTVPDSLRNRAANLAKAAAFGEEALAMCLELDLQQNQLSVLQTLSGVCSLQGNYKQALAYYIAYNQLDSTLYSVENEKEFAQLDAEYKVQKTTDSLKYQNLVKDNELKRRRNTMVGAIGLIIFIASIAILLINRQKLKHRQKRQLAEAEQQRVEELARQQLEDFTQRIHEKNELIEAITADLEKQKEQAASQGQTVAIDYSLLEELQQSILLTDEQWDKFKNTFDKVHKGYLLRLRDKMPDLTPAETRFVVLTRLRLSNKEMGAMLGVAPKAMLASKYRLMKKLGFDEDTHLDTMIHSI